MATTGGAAQTQQDEVKQAVGGLLISRSKIGVSPRWSLLFTIVINAPMLILALLGGIVTEIVGSPLFMLTFISWFLIPSLGSSLVDGLESFLKEKDSLYEEFAALVTRANSVSTVRADLLKKVGSRRTEYGAAFACLLSAIVLYLFAALLLCVTGSVSIPSLCALLLLYVFWGSQMALLASQTDLAYKLSDYVKNLFETPNNFRLLSFQDDLLNSVSLSASDSSQGAGVEDGTTSKRRTVLKTTRSHHGFRNTAILVLRATRGIVVLATASGVEMLIVLMALRFYQTATGLLTSLAEALVVTTLFLCLVFLILQYCEAEWAVHRVLDYSKRNLVAIHDLVFLRDTMALVDRKPPITKEDVEVCKALLDHSTSLPTWTFGSKIVVTIAGGLAVQVIVVIMTVLSRLMT